jgi:dephospho-CoA kinase
VGGTIEGMIIGIAGPSGAGKDTAAAYVENKLHYQHISGGNVIREIFIQLGLEPTRPAVGDFAQLLRKHFGADAIVKAIIAMSNDKNVIVSGFRSPLETKVVQDNGGIIIYIDALPEVRCQRILLRSRPGDPTTTEEFSDLDARESGADSSGENVGSIKATADIVIANNGSVEDMHGELERILRTLPARR